LSIRLRISCRKGNLRSSVKPGPEQQIASFAGYLEDRYFPLPHFLRFGNAEEYSDLTQSIPLIALGFGYKDYNYAPYPAWLFVCVVHHVMKVVRFIKDLLKPQDVGKHLATA
jgi:hypothetical protein